MVHWKNHFDEPVAWKNVKQSLAAVDFVKLKLLRSIASNRSVIKGVDGGLAFTKFVTGVKPPKVAEVTEEWATRQQSEMGRFQNLFYFFDDSVKLTDREFPGIEKRPSHNGFQKGLHALIDQFNRRYWTGVLMEGVQEGSCLDLNSNLILLGKPDTNYYIWNTSIWLEAQNHGRHMPKGTLSSDKVHNVLGWPCFRFKPMSACVSDSESLPDDLKAIPCIISGDQIAQVKGSFAFPERGKGTNPGWIRDYFMIAKVPNLFQLCPDNKYSSDNNFVPCHQALILAGCTFGGARAALLCIFKQDFLDFIANSINLGYFQVLGTVKLDALGNPLAGSIEFDETTLRLIEPFRGALPDS